MMANPQCEYGFVKIANELVEAFAKYRLPGEEWQVLLVVLRKTYGFNKISDEIPLSQFEELTGLKRANVARSLKKLVAKGILGSSKIATTHATRYWFNKDFEKWEPSIKKATLVAKAIRRPVVKAIPSKDNYSKDIKPSSPESCRLSSLLATLILRNNPRNTQLNNGKHEATVARWAKDIEKMIRIDGQDPDEIERVIRWCQTDDFWRKNILSGSKLRDQFDRLVVGMRPKGYRVAVGDDFQTQHEWETIV